MKRLYVLIRNDLPSAVQAVQAGHAVAKWALSDGEKDHRWGNEVLVYLKSDNEKALLTTAELLDLFGITPEIWREPDLENQATAMAVCHPSAQSFFKKFPLLR